MTQMCVFYLLGLAYWAELERTGMKRANVQIYCVLCLFTRVNVSRDITHSARIKRVIFHAGVHNHI
jgi:hypothetical protein